MSYSGRYRRGEVARALIAAAATAVIAVLASRASSGREICACATASVALGIGWAEFEQTGRRPQASLMSLGLLTLGVFFGGPVLAIAARGHIQSSVLLPIMMIASWGLLGLSLGRWSERVYLSTLPPKVRKKRSQMKTKQHIATGLSGVVGLIAGLVLPVSAIENSREPLKQQVSVIVIRCNGARLPLTSDANMALTVDGGKIRDYSPTKGVFSYDFPLIFRQSHLSVTAPEISASPLEQFHAPKLGSLYSDILWKVSSLGLSTSQNEGLNGYFQAREFCPR